MQPTQGVFVGDLLFKLVAAKPNGAEQVESSTPVKREQHWP
jgi:hypothetical protein